MRPQIIRLTPAALFLVLLLLTFLVWQQQAGLAGWRATFLVPLGGLLMSAAGSWLLHLLLHQMEQHQAAQQLALAEELARRQAQHAARMSRARYRRVFDSATEGLLVLHRDGSILDANPAACRMHGHEQDGLAGMTIQQLLASGHEQQFDELRHQLEESGYARLEAVHRRADGSTFDLVTRSIRSGTAHMLVTLTDVSELKKAIQRHARLSRKVLMAQEEERVRVSRDLHDELGQMLTAIRLELDWVQRRAQPASEELDEAIGMAVEMVEKAAEELRHICKGLRPPLLDDLGLEPAIVQLVEDFEEWTGLTFNLKVQLHEERRTSPEVALCTYRILQESLNNITRHARAKNVNISLSDRGGELLLSVYDDGQGFDQTEQESFKGSGIAGMFERASLVNAKLQVRAEPHQGTRVVLRVPTQKE